MMTLYYGRGTIAVAVAIALEEAGLPYETVAMDLAGGAQTKPDYLTLNPKGRVPALMLQDGSVLTEAGALLEYIAALAPDAQLTPDAPEDAAHMRSVMYYLASTMHVAHAHRFRGSRWADAQSSLDDMRARVPATMSACAAYVQTDCLRGAYVLGDRISIADCYLFMLCSWLEGDGVDVAAFPQITAFLDRMERRASVKAIRSRGML